MLSPLRLLLLATTTLALPLGFPPTRHSTSSATANRGMTFRMVDPISLSTVSAFTLDPHTSTAIKTAMSTLLTSRASRPKGLPVGFFEPDKASNEMEIISAPLMASQCDAFARSFKKWRSVAYDRGHCAVVGDYTIDRSKNGKEVENPFKERQREEREREGREALGLEWKGKVQ